MEFEDLKPRIKEIVEFVRESVPEEFQVACFELLLRRELGLPESALGMEDARRRDVEGEPQVRLTGSLRLFMRKYHIREDLLSAVVLQTDDTVDFVKKPGEEVKKQADGEFQWALLLCLKNAFEKDSFEADANELRARCEEEAFCDKNNFWAILGRRHAAGYFKDKPTKSQPQVKLSDSGQEALADLLRSLGGGETQ